MKSINITIGGDIYLGNGVEKIASEKPDDLFHDSVKKLFSSDSFNIINLESPITDCSKAHEIIKTGPHIKAKPESLIALKKLNIDLVTLANNHILDYGEKGLSDTFENLAKNNIDFVGAGKDLTHAKTTYLKSFDNLNLAIINVAENEWANANQIHGGANPIDIVDNTLQIQQAKKEADIVILIIHGGHENYAYPSPRMVKEYRFYADQGADVIVCHHAHCTSGYETYNETPIFYGIGNFLFNSNTKLNGWNNGMVVSLSIDSSKNISWTLHPYKQCLNSITVELLVGKEKEIFESEILKINRIITNPDDLYIKFKDFANQNRSMVLEMFSNSNIFYFRYIKGALRKFKLQPFFLRKNQLKSILNYTRCEAHNDITQEILTDYLKR